MRGAACFSSRKAARLSTVRAQLATVRAVAATDKDKLDKSPTKHRKIGAYRVLGELGRGGMAQVYKGLHETIQREVAIKELLPEAQRDKESCPASTARRSPWPPSGTRTSSRSTTWWRRTTASSW